MGKSMGAHAASAYAVKWKYRCKFQIQEKRRQCERRTDHASKRFDTQLVSLLPRHEDQGTGAIVKCRRVSGREGSYITCPL